MRFHTFCKFLKSRLRPPPPPPPPPPLYRTQFFYIRWTKLDLAHVFLFERAQSVHFVHGVWKNIVRYTYHRWFFTRVIVTLRNLTLMLESKFSHLYRNILIFGRCIWILNPLLAIVGCANHLLTQDSWIHIILELMHLLPSLTREFGWLFDSNK